MKTIIASTALLVSAVLAAPTPSLVKRADIDTTILNYALTLEHLEATFYKQGLANFSESDFTSAGFTEANFYTNLQQLAVDEATHVTFLTGALQAAGATPVAQCTYDFGSLTAKSFMETSMILEGVGVSAYLGAAALVTSKTILTAAGSILTDEARHDSFIRTANIQSAIPQAFDVPLDFNQVFSMAAPFIVSCPPSNPTLPVKAFPTLELQAETNITQGSVLTFHTAATLPSGQLYIAFPLVTGPIFQPVTQDGDGCLFAQVPTSGPAGGSGAPAGQAYAILTTSNTVLSDNNTIAGPAIIEITPPAPMPV